MTARLSLRQRQSSVLLLLLDRAIGHGCASVPLREAPSCVVPCGVSGIM
jgi:hypothetical protein